MAAHKLGENEIAAELESIREWTLVNAKLHREYKFPDFAHAIGFMAGCAPLIEKMNHHPEWFNVYGRVVVDLTTHDSGGVTKRDFELAKILESMAVKLL
ncbi:MAG: pterin-4-alpha-carbinolamine dehydratase [Bryobacterales bacterium]|nr:pterin-4-alpha-carbinolamine dehydratase [Bryobacterales bacterium]